MNRREDAEKFQGTYVCTEFSSRWKVEIQEGKKDVWEVHVDHPEDKSAPIKFEPQPDSNGALVFQSTYAGTIEATDNGFVWTGGKMDPVHFVRDS